MLKVTHFLLLVIPLAHSQVPGFGGCPSNVQVVTDFNLNAYLGEWYEYERYPFIFEAGGKCTIARYESLTNGTISVNNSNINSITKRKSEILGTAEVRAPGKLYVRFPSMPEFVGGADYWILGTDYTSYAVVYSCTDFYGFFNTKVVWILTRERQPNESAVAQARSVLDDNKLSKRFLLKTSQENCPEN